MGLFKRGQTFWISFSYKGKQVRQSLETDDKKTAEKIYHKVMTEVAEGKWFEKPEGASRTFREMMEKYMAEHSRPNKASWGRDERSLAHLLPVFSGVIVTEIRRRMINAYKTKRRQEGASTCSVNRELALMKHAYSLAIKEWEWTKENPVKMVSMEKEPPSRDRWLSYGEEKALLSAASPWLKEIVAFAIETGCRKEEMLSLTWRNVDLPQKVVTIFGKKTGERRTIPLTAAAHDILMARFNVKGKVQALREEFVFSYPPGRKVSTHTVRSAFDDALKKARITDFRFHDLRHTFATRLSQSGVDPYTVQTLLGHTSFATTKRYAHHYTESLRRGIVALDKARRDENNRSITILSQ